MSMKDIVKEVKLSRKGKAIELCKQRSMSAYRNGWWKRSCYRDVVLAFGTTGRVIAPMHVIEASIRAVTGISIGTAELLSTQFYEDLVKACGYSSRPSRREISKIIKVRI